MMNYLKLSIFFLTFFVLANCARQNHLNIATHQTFVPSVEKDKLKNKENLKTIPKKTSFSLKPTKKTYNLSSYRDKLKQIIGAKETIVTKIFVDPNYVIKYGKIKNLQFHFSSCHIDLFFLEKESDYVLNHFEFRSSKLSNVFNEKKCFKEIKNRFNLRHSLD